MFSTGSYLQFRETRRYPKGKRDWGEKRCDVCKISMRGQEQFDAHLRGSKHAKKTKEAENTRKIEAVSCITFDSAGESYTCTICNVTLNSSSVAMFHVMGSRHQEKSKEIKPEETPAVKQVETIVETTPNGQAMTTNRQETTPNRQETTPNRQETGENSMLWSRRGPQTVGNGGSNGSAEPTKMAPSDGPRHMNHEQTQSPDAMSKFKYVVKPLSDSFVQKYTLTSETTVVRSVTAVSQSGSYTGPMGVNPPAKGISYPCRTCNIVTNSKQQLHQHLSSEKHKANVMPMRPLMPTQPHPHSFRRAPPPLLPGMFNPRPGPRGLAPFPRSPAPFFRGPAPPPKGCFPCQVCNIVTNSDQQLQQHLSSEKHKYNCSSASSGKAAKRQFLPPSNYTSLKCESCGTTVNSQVQLDQHLQSAKHRNKLVRRYQPYQRPVPA